MTICAGLGLAVLPGCAGQMRMPVTQSGQQELIDRNINIIAVTSDNIHQYRQARWTDPNGLAAPNPPADPAVYSYRVGPGDQLRVQTWTTPERTTDTNDITLAEGPVVDGNGVFFYPFVGDIHASGRTVSQIRDELSQKLRAYIADPQVEVAVAAFHAHQATITGAVGTPGPTVLTNVPLRLLDLVNAAGTTPESDLRNVVIRRRGVRHSANLRAFIEEGRLGNNPIMMPGDLVFVPPLADNKIFTFGEIGTGEIPLGPERKSLTEVLAAKGGIDRVRADARGIFVFRRTGTSPEGFDVFQFDLRDATALMLTADFAMAPLDIVFVTNDPVTRWNDTVGKVISPLSGVARVDAVADELKD
ncbi:MAG: polysaccharide biosynthesis/export family protein [Rhodobacteraceae bacterium]|nr:polysaccharide biosynthesis/export family protein [Paracoccaceae bacterium]